MPKGKNKKIPKWGRSRKEVNKDLGLRQFSHDVPLGNTDPTVVQGTLGGGMPNASRRAKGRLTQQKGKY